MPFLVYRPALDYLDQAVLMAVKYGACDPVVYHLRRSNLLDRSRLDQVLTDYMESQTPLEPAVMADYLIRQKILTPYQVKRVLQGKSENLVLGPYSVLEELGFGSMGVVYKARSKNDSRHPEVEGGVKRWYALKLMPRRSVWNVRIAKRLVRAFGNIRHPAVVSFVDVNTVGGHLCLVWPYVEGETLENLVERKGRLLPGVAALFTLQAAEGLAVCHHQGLIHGLLKPPNFIVGPNQEIRVIDFGTGALLAETEGAELIDTMSTANVVTSGLDCRSPENILDVKVRTAAGDQYSLGCVLYYCLTGQYPFPGESAVEKMLAHQIKDPTPIRSLRPEVPVALVEIVQRLMHKTPEGRYSSLDDAIQALHPLAVTQEVAGRLLALEIPDSLVLEQETQSSQAAEVETTFSPPVSPDPLPVAKCHIEQGRPDSPFAFHAPTIRKEDADQRLKQTSGRGKAKLILLACMVAAVALGLILWLISRG
jgi:serine/threonine-protein kinase